MLSKSNWDETKARWTSYWNGTLTGLPLMHIVARKQSDVHLTEPPENTGSMYDKYMDAAKIDARFRHYICTHEYLHDSFPNVSLDFGPGSMVAYLGSDIEFRDDTVWFSECVDDWSSYPPLKFDPENKWFKRHIQLFRDVKRLAKGDYYLAIPDIMENIDVLASLRGAQNTIFDMMDEPEELQERISQVQNLYYRYYDSFFDIASETEDGRATSCYTVFQIWGYGKTLKLQCDFSAMMSPAQFIEFVQPALRSQSGQADNVLYHLDGPDAIKHLPALMDIEGIKSLQWTSGSYNPDGTHEIWYPIYDQVIRAGKLIWVQVYSGGADDWIKRIDKLVRRYGSQKIFLYFPPMPMQDAEKIINHARQFWNDTEGSFH